MKKVKWTTRLILIFIGMVLLTGVFSGILALKSINTQFNQYLGKSWKGQADKYAEAISIYYEVNGSLEGVEEILWSTQGVTGKGKGGFRSMRGMNGGFYLIDKKGIVLWHPEEKEIGAKINLLSDHNKYPIQSEGKTIGYLVHYSKLFPGGVTLEEEFSRSVLKALVEGTLISITIAILLGLVLTPSLLKPFRRLYEAGREYASGNLQHRIEREGSPDILQVYDAFNEMAENLAKQENLRRELMADVAHELRTPLTILSGNLESMQEGIQDITPETLVSLHDEILRLRSLVEELQQLSLAEANKLILHKEPTDMALFLQETLSFFEVEAKEKDITLSFKKEGDIPLIQIDKGRMRQVFINLISNAMRYVPEKKGHVRVILERSDEKIVIYISDNGVGIAKEDLPYVFDRLYKGDKSRNRQSGGSGLGLAIAKGFVEAHGGSIEVESTLNKGTIFIICFQIIL